ncbi:MAG: transcriptional regulator, partial [Burkholderiales bacterium PBB5]
LRAHPLGLLVHTDADGAPVANPVPLHLDPTRGPQGTLVGHVARANPVWQQAAGRAVLVVFQGPQGYISPNGYPSKAQHGKVVPTWNYAVVQARGPLQVLDEAATKHAIVNRLTQQHEATQARPWAVADAPADYIDQMLRAIVGIEIPLQSLVGKFKLSQNRSAQDLGGVTAALQASTDNPAAQQLAAWMQQGGPGAQP